MTERLPDNVAPYLNISPKAYEHPADRAATAALKSVPMLDTVVRKLVEWGYERALRQSFLGNSVRVGENQLPELWASHTAVCRILDLPETHHLYVCWGVMGGAQTVGSGKPMVVIDSALLEKLGPGEQRVVLAHEAGHILSDHVLYMTALTIMLRMASAGIPFPIGAAPPAARTVLLEWYRATELTCDRAATLAVRDPQIVCRALMVMAGGLPADRLSLDAFMSQAMEYAQLGGPQRPAAPFLQRDRPHPPLRRAPRLGGHGVGQDRRVRPHRPG